MRVIGRLQESGTWPPGWAPGGGVGLLGSDFPKQGRKSAGVARQYCGRLGKVANCQGGMFLAYVSPLGRALVDKRLYLPKSWTSDQAAGPVCCGGVPEDWSQSKGGTRAGQRRSWPLEMLERVLELGYLRAEWVAGKTTPSGCRRPSGRAWLPGGPWGWPPATCWTLQAALRSGPWTRKLGPVRNGPGVRPASPQTQPPAAIWAAANYIGLAWSSAADPLYYNDELSGRRLGGRWMRWPRDSQEFHTFFALLGRKFSGPAGITFRAAGAGPGAAQSPAWASRPGRCSAFSPRPGGPEQSWRAANTWPQATLPVPTTPQEGRKSGSGPEYCGRLGKVLPGWDVPGLQPAGPGVGGQAEYLPKSWTSDQEMCCGGCGRNYRSTELARDAGAGPGGGLPQGRVGCRRRRFGMSPTFREGLAALGMRYVLDVPGGKSLALGSRLGPVRYAADANPSWAWAAADHGAARCELPAWREDNGGPGNSNEPVQCPAGAGHQEAPPGEEPAGAGTWTAASPATTCPTSRGHNLGDSGLLEGSSGH